MKKVILFALAIISLTSCESDVTKEVRRSLETEIYVSEGMVEIYQARFDSIQPIYDQLLEAVLEDKISLYDSKFTGVKTSYEFTIETLDLHREKVKEAKYKLAAL